MAALALAAVSTPVVADDGDLDLSFNGTGQVTEMWGRPATGSRAMSIAGGKVLIAGKLDNPAAWAVSVFLADGEDDGDWDLVFEPFDFAGDGIDVVEDVLAVGRDAGERTWIAGRAEDVEEENQLGLARLTALGALDPAFGGDGQVVVPLPAGWHLNSVVDARIPAAGGALFVGRCSGCGGPEEDPLVFVARVLPSGAPDPGFSGDGFLTFAPLASPNARAVELSASGAITVACSGTAAGQAATALVRFTAAGLPDPSFGGGDGVGTVVLTPSRSATSMAIDPDTGKIVVGMGSGSVEGGGLLGFQADGNLDPAFGPVDSPGRVDLDIEEGSSIESVIFESGGKILAVGEIDANGAQSGGFFLVRALANGTLDPTFDGNGLKRVEFDKVVNGADGAFSATLVGGRLVAAGVTRGDGLERDFAALRLENALILADGFERGSTGGWLGY